MSRPWLDALHAAGVTPAAFVPDASLGRTADLEDDPGAKADVVLLGGDEPAIHPVTAVPAPAGTAFLDGIQHWAVVGYDGVLPIVQAYVAAAVRTRGPDRRLATAGHAEREFVIAPLAAMQTERRRLLEHGGVDVVSLPQDVPMQPGHLLEAARREVHRARAALEKRLAEDTLAQLGPDQWLVVDGQLSVFARLARHPRTVGVIKSHGAQFLEGRHLERALTVPAAHRTDVFQVTGGHGRTAVHSWYLRLWPWEGNDLHYGLLRVEARADEATVAGAGTLSGWLLAERTPLAAPDARFDRLLYPIHDVETYLRTRMPRDLLAARGSRLPRTGT